MKVLHAADIHLGLTRYGHPTAAGGNSRIDDFGLTLDRIADVAIEQQVAAVVIPGDLFNSRREGPQERNAFARFARRLQAAGIVLIIVPGNHDGMATIGDATTHALLWIGTLELDGIHLLTRPGAHVLKTRAGPLVVYAVPYPHKRGFDTILPDEPDQEARILAAGAKVDGMIRHWGEQAGDADGAPAILVGHFTTVAAKPGSETTMKMTWDVSISPDTFAPFDGVLLGHIHRQQQVAPNAWYAGSPDFIDFSEQEHRKGFLLWEVAAGQPPVVTHIASNPRPMMTITFLGETDSDMGASFPESFAGAIVRLQFATPTRPRVDTISRLREDALRHGASTVVIDWKPPATAATRARVTLAGDTPRDEMVRAWLEANGYPIEPMLTAGRDLIARTYGA